jgi:hypothetical protein
VLFLKMIVLPSHIAWASLQLSFHFEVRSLRAFGVPLHQTHPILVGGGGCTMHKDEGRKDVIDVL